MSPGRSIADISTRHQMARSHRTVTTSDISSVHETTLAPDSSTADVSTGYRLANAWDIGRILPERITYRGYQLGREVCFCVEPYSTSVPRIA
eukprot:3794136-Rhodomonas_salina.2